MSIDFIVCKLYLISVSCDLLSVALNYKCNKKEAGSMCEKKEDIV